MRFTAYKKTLNNNNNNDNNTHLQIVELEGVALLKPAQVLAVLLHAVVGEVHHLGPAARGGRGGGVGGSQV